MTKHSPRTASSIFLKGFKEPYLRSNDRPFIKLLNWYTGFGKTYTAAAFSIELFANCDVIPVFIAPLQSLVGGFSDELAKHQKKGGEYADEIESAIRERGYSIPVHRLYSIEYHLNDRSFFQACLQLVGWLERHQSLFPRLETSAKYADTDKSVRARVNELRQKALYCEQSNFLTMATSDDTYEDTRTAYIKAAQRARTLADSLVWRLIKLDVETRHLKQDADRFMRAKEVAELVRRLHPLQAFLDNPGVIVSTASKAQVGHQVYGPDGKGGFKAHKYDNLPLFLEELNRDGSYFGQLVSGRPDSARVVTFVDEEEDSYWYLFDQRKSVVNSGGRNDLNLVISEFFQYFDLRWPMAFERLRRDGPTDLALATKVYDHLEHFAQVSKAVEDEFAMEVSRTSAKYINDARRVEILRKHLTAQAPATAKRFDDNELQLVTVWAGAFVPKIILNDSYEGIEDAIAAQDGYLAERREEGSKGRFLSKGREFNLLPYYISMFKPEHAKHGERVGLRMPVQDCGTYVRVFVPPEGGVSGSGDALSGMRDVMHFDASGALTMAGLLDLPLVHLYLHTMTNGVLVGGDNSKMSVLEKLARLALEN